MAAKRKSKTRKSRVDEARDVYNAVIALGQAATAARKAGVSQKAAVELLISTWNSLERDGLAD